MNVVAILAAGSGTRMGATIPKQYLEVNGKPVIIRTTEKYLKNKQISFVYLAINSDWESYTKKLLEKYKIPTERLKLVYGGASRFISMKNIVDQAFYDGFENDNLIVQDCARPFVPNDVIDDLIEKKSKFDMATACINAVETIILSNKGTDAEQMPPRADSYLNQGPQIFNIKQAKTMMDNLSEEERINFIEAAIMYLKNGLTVGISKGSPYNFKLTTPFDLKLAEIVAKEEDEKERTL